MSRKRYPIYTHHQEEALSDVYSSLNSLLQLHSQLDDVYGKGYRDKTIQTQLDIVKRDIRNRVGVLLRRGVSLADLAVRFGTLLFK